MSHKNSIILSIETSLDETCAAVTVGRRVFSNIISSQVELHRKYGGVVPIIAKRAHEERVPIVVEEAIKRANYTLKRFNQKETKESIAKKKQYVREKFSNLSRKGFAFNTLDAIAVTYGPGQALALEIGIRYAKKLAREYDKPLIAVNHMEGHLLSAFATNSRGKGSSIAKKRQYVRQKFSNGFALLGLLVSGGHTELVLVKGIGNYEVLGETLDDAAGEAFDKVGRMLELGYPGGPVVEQIAKQGNENAFDFPVPMSKREDLNFSYSGIKTAVLYKIRDLKRSGNWDRKTIQDLAASFQKVMAKSLTVKLRTAVKKYNTHGVLLGGGVISNIYIRRKIRQEMRRYGLEVYIPYDKLLFTDNAAMIGVAAGFKPARVEFVENIDLLDREPNAKVDKATQGCFFGRSAVRLVKN